MEIIGIICEYNPFHNGHLYHINKIKEMYPDSLIVLVVNGYFLQRGEISILPKEDKVKIALENNIDIVLELPFIYGTQSADNFANYAIRILNNFKISKLVFGSECNDIEKLKSIASLQLEEKYKLNLKKHLKNGVNYPTALAKSLEIENFSFTPNDLLGISYIKTILINNYNIEPISIKRTNDYHDLTSNEQIISASNIRNKLNNNLDIKKYLPNNIIDNLINVNYALYFILLKFKILTSTTLNDILDVDEGIEYRLKKYIMLSNNLDDFINNIKTKRYTYNKLNRMLIHILNNFKKIDNIDINYIRILGFNKNGKNYLSRFKNFEIPIKVDKDSIQYRYELQASILYDLINNTNTFEFEIKNKPMIKD